MEYGQHLHSIIQSTYMNNKTHQPSVKLEQLTLRWQVVALTLAIAFGVIVAIAGLSYVVRMLNPNPVSNVAKEKQPEPSIVDVLVYSPPDVELSPPDLEVLREKEARCIDLAPKL
jgi:hypothetical protein